MSATGGKEMPSLEPSSAHQLPESTNCLACSEDGRYLGLGHAQGLSVWCVSSLTPMAEWQRDQMEVTSVQITNMADTAYLLSTIDDMGVARVFAYHSEVIHLLTVINTMEDINKRTICLVFELSKGGDLGSATFSCNSAVWIEVYQFPSEAWLKELETAATVKQDFSGVMKWSPVGVLIKIKPPKVPSGVTGQEIPHDHPQVLTHCLALDRTNDSPRQCTQHFLLPCGHIPADRKVKSGSPVAVCMWWGGSHNLLQYFLHKTTKNKPEVEPAPDVLWANADEIICSAVSRCTRFIALGLSNALVCVWDRHSGSPLSVVVVTSDSPFLQLQFVDHRPNSAEDSQSLAMGEIHLIALCKSGELLTVTTGRDTKPSSAQHAERPTERKDLPILTVSVPFLQGLSLVVDRSGKMLLQDVINKASVCFMALPPTHLLATPCSSIYALSVQQQVLFVRGDQDSSRGRELQQDRRSQLFAFRFGEAQIMKPYIIAPPEPSQRKLLSFIALEEACDLYLQQRALSAVERHREIQETWKRLQETSAKAQQSLSSSSSS